MIALISNRIYEMCGGCITSMTLSNYEIIINSAYFTRQPKTKIDVFGVRLSFSFPFAWRSSRLNRKDARLVSSFILANLNLNVYALRMHAKYWTVNWNFIPCAEMLLNINNRWIIWILSFWQTHGDLRRFCTFRERLQLNESEIVLIVEICLSSEWWILLPSGWIEASGSPAVIDRGKKETPLSTFRRRTMHKYLSFSFLTNHELWEFFQWIWSARTIIITSLIQKTTFIITNGQNDVVHSLLFVAEIKFATRAISMCRGDRSSNAARSDTKIALLYMKYDEDNRRHRIHAFVCACGWVLAPEIT